MSDCKYQYMVRIQHTSTRKGTNNMDHKKALIFFIYKEKNQSSKIWSSQLWTQFKQLRIEAWKSQSYEATDVGSWSFVSSNEKKKNGCEMIYEMFHIPTSVASVG